MLNKQMPQKQNKQFIKNKFCIFLVFNEQLFTEFQVLFQMLEIQS